MFLIHPLKQPASVAEPGCLPFSLQIRQCSRRRERLIIDQVGWVGGRGCDLNRIILVKYKLASHHLPCAEGTLSGGLAERVERRAAVSCVSSTCITRWLMYLAHACSQVAAGREQGVNRSSCSGCEQLQYTQGVQRLDMLCFSQPSIWLQS